ncbi:DUF6497 family protein [Defluviimonas sp. SAOS-178_SWC]|uniref:DUF6497 family protein n=1 Tax=Defluviimonas sp. SAOS-178_SWC TaxID=3121287 RepID=UPI003221D6C9
MLWFALGGTEEQAPVAPAGIVPPSGQEISFLETVQSAPGTEGLAVRFRFVAPGITKVGGSVDAEAAQADMLWLCDTYALPRLPSTGPAPAQIVISLSDRAVLFGEAAPDATQFFEAYSIEDGHCVWEPF